ncbi:MAG: iron chelate uptake ABC transporter family permease subunit [Actinomycetaceae bacterium]|nr:iron chelate uptake ABC transporter family permease subunit [Actinomycetaceae bacterium]
MMTSVSDISAPTQPPPLTRPKERIPLLLGACAVLALAALSLCVGVYDILGQPDGMRIFFITRIPRTASLLLSGAAMAMCGLVMQQITRNRFVEPTTTGTTEWAGLGLLLVLMFVPTAPLMVKMVAAIISAFAGTLIFFLILRRLELRSPVIVPIVGIMLGAVVGAVSSLLALSSNLLQSVGIWFMGSFASVVEGQYEPMWAILFVVIGVFIAADRITIAGLGKDVATSLGLNHEQIVFISTGLVAIATGIVTVVIGNLPFIGLIIPNLVSMWRGDDTRSSLPWVCLSGAALVTICDIFSRVVIMPFEVPVGTILSIVGAGVFLVLLLRDHRHV